MSKFTIGQISKTVGLPTKTIRFYEEVGLITSPKRSENGYREYSEETINTLAMIKYARDLGLPIAEIKKLMKGCSDGNCEHTQTYIKVEIKNYIELVEKKIQQLTKLKTQLILLQQQVKTGEVCDKDDAYCCDILNQLTKISKGGEA